MLAVGRARADRQTDPPNLGVSKAVALLEPLLLLLLLLSGTVLTLAPCQDGGQWAAVWGGPTTHCARTVPGSTIGLWGCCCSFAPWLPGNGERKRQSSGSSGAEC